MDMPQEAVEGRSRDDMGKEGFRNLMGRQHKAEE